MLLEDCSLRLSLLVLLGAWINGVAIGIVLSGARVERWWRRWR